MSRTMSGKGRESWVTAMRKMPCHYCGAAGGTIDHKIPKSKGGKNSRSNCLPCCWACNNFRKDMDYESFKAWGWKRRPFSQ